MLLDYRLGGLKCLRRARQIDRAEDYRGPPAQGRYPSWQLCLIDTGRIIKVCIGPTSMLPTEAAGL